MKIFGIDFTSAPSNTKPLTCAAADLTNRTLMLAKIETWNSFQGFIEFLGAPGPWRAGCDFPFGQPRELVTNLNIPGDWSDVVERFNNLTKREFVEWLRVYRARRPKGNKQHRRQTDVRAGACSPMMVYGVPVARMFYEGASRLRASGVCILPVRPTTDDRVVVEAYPKLVARRYCGASYKAEAAAKQTANQLSARTQILIGLQQHSLNHFGFSVVLEPAVFTAAREDPTGDKLDAVLCAVQAAWSHQCENPAEGIPVNCDLIEGWIVDPKQLMP